MLSRVSAGGLLVMWVSVLLPFLSTAVISKKIRMISTDGRASLPAKAGQAEILNSSLEKYPELTLCARLLTHSFSRTFYGWPTQALISYGSDPLLGSFVTRSCDQFYEGCTKVYRDLLSRNHIPWIAGKVFGYVGMG